jgi:DNA-binding CsgD family transcriptional regulator
VKAEIAAEEFLHGCMAAGDIASAIGGFADAAGADGAVLVHTRSGQALRAVSSAAIADPVADYMLRDRPADPRAGRVNPTLLEGFRVDHDDFRQTELDRDPFYQEFLRPRGFGWHACALLAAGPEGDEVHLSLKRGIGGTPFSHDQLTSASAQLPMLRAAVSIGLGMGLQPTAPDTEWGDRRFVYRLDRRGQAMLVGGEAGPNPVLAIRAGQLRPHGAANRTKVKTALGRALGSGAQCAALLTDETGRRWSCRIIPDNRPMEAVSQAWLVLAALDPDAADNADSLIGIGADLFGLTRAEARVAFWIGRGETIDAVSRRLASRPGTVRNQLKSVFQKIGVSRQAELAAVLARL